MSHTCYIIDDEFHAVEVLETYIRQTPWLELIGTSMDPISGIATMNTNNPPELLFLDVDMPQMNGLDVAALCRKETAIIFTTSFREYAPEAFETNAVDYLLKPFNYARFLKAINKFRENQKCQTAGSDYFFVKGSVKGKYNRIHIPDIRYIENIGNYISIHLEKDKVTTYLTLAEVMAKLPEGNFSRIHQSFVVNHDYITSVEYGQVRLAGQVVLPVGGTYRAAFRDKIQQEFVTTRRDSKNQ